MKIRANWLLMCAAVLSLGSCGKKEEPKTPAPAAPVEAPAKVQEPAAKPADKPVAKTTVLSPDERAAKLGFAKYLPQNTEVVMAFHNGLKSASRISSSKLWKLIEGQMGGMGGGNLPPIDMQEEDFQLPEGEQEATADDVDLPVMPDAGAGQASGPGVLFGTEFTLALGQSAGEQGANVLGGYRRMNYFQMRMLAKAFAAAAKAGDFSSMDQAVAEQYGPELFKDLLMDPESGVGLIDRMNMPPLYLAFRTSAADRAAASQQLAGMVENLAMLGDMVEPVEVETAGQKFTGHKLSGEKIAKSMEATRGEMESMLEPAVVDKILAAIAKKNLVVVTGTLGDYAILFVGSSVDDLKFAATPAQSLVASEALAFCDAYAAKELAAVIYGQKGAMDKLIAAAGGLADMTAGLRDGLAGAEGLGDTRDLEALLRLVGERETAMRKLAGTDSLGMAAFFEDGLKVESHGGTDSGAVDWKAENKLGALGDGEEVVMFANMTTEAAYDVKAQAYMEALVETGYALAMKASEVKADDEQFKKFKSMAKLFDSDFRTDAVAMWDAFNGDFGASLGKEWACIVDLKGAVPAIPGIPKAVIDGGKFPRISMVAPVTDRVKLAGSWQKMNASATSILAKLGKVTGEEIPMQKPISSEKDGYTTWFFSLPFFSNDFVPSVTVGDKWFAASTSKNQALDLVNQAAKATETRTGMVFTVNFKALQKFSRETLKLLEKDDEAKLPASKMADALKLIDAMDDLDKLTVHARRENGVLRSSVHFKTR